MVQSTSWDANWFAASQEIPRISRNPKVHYRTHKRPPPASILGQSNPVHIPTSHLLEFRPIIHPSTPRSPQWFFPSGFPTKTIHIHPPGAQFFFPKNLGATSHSWRQKGKLDAGSTLRTNRSRAPCKPCRYLKPSLRSKWKDTYIVHKRVGGGGRCCCRNNYAENITCHWTKCTCAEYKGSVICTPRFYNLQLLKFGDMRFTT